MMQMTPPAAPVGGPFELVNHDGQPVGNETYRGKFALVSFGFSHCKVVCPRALQRLSDALEALGPMAEMVQPLYVSIDPERDTPARMREFLAAWPRFRGLTGSPEQISAVKSVFRVFAERRDAPAGYDMPHSAITHLLDPEGRHIDHWPDVLTVGEIADRLFESLCPHVFTIK